MTIDELGAKEIARRFLEQHHSIIELEAMLEDEVWNVSAKIGFTPKDVKKVRIYAKTGGILSCS